jgi:hypothetical protein
LNGEMQALQEKKLKLVSGSVKAVKAAKVKRDI